MRKMSNRSVVSILAMTMAVGGAALLQVGCVEESQGTESDGDEAVGLEAESPLAPSADELRDVEAGESEPDEISGKKAQIMRVLSHHPLHSGVGLLRMFL
jgi:hypothetical protein